MQKFDLKKFMGDINKKKTKDFDKRDKKVKKPHTLVTFFDRRI